MSELIYKEEVYRVIGAAMEVFNVLGPGFQEAVYQEALALEFVERGIPHQQQVPIQIRYKEHLLEKYYIADFLAFEAIVIELKAENRLLAQDESQLINYLKSTRLQLGVLINFGSYPNLEWKRMACTQHKILIREDSRGSRLV